MGIYDNAYQRPIKQIEEYNEYLKMHIDGVSKAWNDYADRLIKIFNLSKDEISLIENLINNHDKSKYEKVEFNPYREKFYPTDDEKDKGRSELQEEEYRLAILDHYHKNLHHWNHWVYYDINEPETPTILNIPIIYLVELICDWISVTNRTKGASSDPLAYYNKNKDEILLSEKTRNDLENALNTLFGGNENE